MLQISIFTEEIVGYIPKEYDEEIDNLLVQRINNFNMKTSIFTAAEQKNYYNTALQKAVEAGYSKVVGKLMDRDVDVITIYQ